MIVKFLDKRHCAPAAASQLSLFSSCLYSFSGAYRDAKRRLYADLIVSKMGSVQILKTLGVGKVCVMVRSNGVHYSESQGATMDITVNESEPEGSVDRYSMDTYVSGEEQLLIPPHWHKVSEGTRQTPLVHSLSGALIL